MKPRLIVVLVAAAVLVGALIWLLVPVQATSPGGRALACGNGFYSNNLAADAPASQQDLAAEIAAARLDTRYGSLLEGYEAVCGDALAVRRGVGFGLAGVGVLALVGVLVVRRPARRSDVAGVPPTA
ncbi:hypothetical protein ACFWIW_10575 [Amycolatopsis sp. NPDC058340]|uniref:hypothetical protein n=1 Tax=Amycolatopsis sp. NPDC058340 TaxID=3346453 RepID=UPI003646F605